MKVESALYKRAIGYDIEETTTEVKIGEDGSGQTTVVKKRKNILREIQQHKYFG